MKPTKVLIGSENSVKMESLGKSFSRFFKSMETKELRLHRQPCAQAWRGMGGSCILDRGSVMFMRNRVGGAGFITSPIPRSHRRSTTVSVASRTQEAFPVRGRRSVFCVQKVFVGTLSFITGVLYFVKFFIDNLLYFL